MRTEFLCVSVMRVASGSSLKLASCKSALTPPAPPPSPPPRWFTLQIIEDSVFSKYEGKDDITLLSRNTLDKSMNSIPLLMNGIVIKCLTLIDLPCSMNCAKIHPQGILGSVEENFLKFLPYMSMAVILVNGPQLFLAIFRFPNLRRSIRNLSKTGLAATK